MRKSNNKQVGAFTPHCQLTFRPFEERLAIAVRKSSVPFCLGIQHPLTTSSLWARQGLFVEGVDPGDIPPMTGEFLAEMADALRSWTPTVVAAKHGDMARLKTFVTCLDYWSQSLNGAQGHHLCDRLSGVQKFRWSSSQLLQSVRFVALLKGGPPKLGEAIRKALTLAVPEFISRTLGGNSQLEDLAVPSASTVRRSQFVLDVAQVLMRTLCVRCA